MIFFSMLYMIFYLEIVISTIGKLRSAKQANPINIQPLMLGSIYALMVAVAIYVSMTRISDYHHHPTDVFSGSVLGSMIAIIQAKYLLKPVYQDILYAH